jgi:hypothetical protein
MCARHKGESRQVKRIAPKTSTNEEPQARALQKLHYKESRGINQQSMRQKGANMPDLAELGGKQPQLHYPHEAFNGKRLV